jgi:hypothetical protein
MEMDIRSSLHVEVADDHLVDVPVHIEIFLNLIDTDGDPFKAFTNNILYVPGLTYILFSASQLAQNDIKA